MMRRLAVALAIALFLLALGISVEFGPPEPEIDVAVFFEIRGDIPGVEFEVEGAPAWSPLLLPVDGSDPGRLEQFPGEIRPVSLRIANPQNFLKLEPLHAELFPDLEWLGPAGSEYYAKRNSHGVLYVGEAQLFWRAWLVASRNSAGERVENLVIGVGVSETERRFPKEYHQARILTIPVRNPLGAPELIPTVRQRSVHFEGPLEKPTRLTYVVTISLAWE